MSEKMKHADFNREWLDACLDLRDAQEEFARMFDRAMARIAALEEALRKIQKLVRNWNGGSYDSLPDAVDAAAAGPGWVLEDK